MVTARTAVGWRHGERWMTRHRRHCLAASAILRWVGPQFEDDLNQLPMGGYLVVDASVARRILPHLELFAAVENLLNRTYLVGRAGIDTVGQR